MVTKKYFVSFGCSGEGGGGLGFEAAFELVDDFCEGGLVVCARVLETAFEGGDDEDGLVAG